jgi:UDP-N-acetylglucosamine 3-dehydrogenase
MKKIAKIGIAGLGHIGKRHLAKYRELGLTAYTADPRMSRDEAIALGSTVHYSDFGEMLEHARPDAVSICLPSPMHRDSALTAFAAGADVLMEKPFALTLEDIDAMMAAAKAAGRRIMVAHVCRFMEQNIIAKETIEGGLLGRPLFLTAWRDSPTPGWSAENWLRNKSASGGTVMDLQIHEIDLAGWFFGPVTGAVLVQRQGADFAGSGFFHSVSSLSYANGTAAALEAGHLMPEGYPFTNGYRLLFERGALEFSQVGRDSTLVLHESGKTTDLTEEYKARSEGRDPFKQEIMHFVECLETGREFTVTCEEARSAVETVLRLTGGEVLGK